jgi:GNAT superfamily N-acetyltransferase
VPGVPASPGRLRPATLRDGEEALLREVRPDDGPVLLELLERVTGDSRVLRFFTGGASIDAAARMEAVVDGRRSRGLLLTTLDGATVLGHGMVVPAGPELAEIAFEVADGHHRRGIGTVLLHALAEGARDAGYTALTAEVLPANRDMIDMLTTSGLAMSTVRRDGVLHVVIPLPEAPA